MCSSPHWQVGLSWFREKLSPANREQRLFWWADFAKNCLPRIGSKELPRFRENIALLGAKKWGPTCDRDKSNSAIYKTAIYWEYTVYDDSLSTEVSVTKFHEFWIKMHNIFFDNIGNIIMYSQLISFLHTDKTQEILPHEKTGLAYFT